jgi:hypothetical protein
MWVSGDQGMLKEGSRKVLAKLAEFGEGTFLDDGSSANSLRES